MPKGKKSKELHPKLTPAQIRAAEKKIKEEKIMSASYFGPPVPPRPRLSSNSKGYVPISPHRKSSRKSSPKTPRSSAKRTRTSNNRTPFQTPQFGSPPMVFSPGSMAMFNPNKNSLATPSTQLTEDMQGLSVENTNIKSPYGFRQAHKDLMNVNPPYLPMKGFSPEDELTEPPPEYKKRNTNKTKRK
jgi:hypothetical protein